MARILDRLQPSNAPGLPRGVYTNQQRVCEQVEEFVTDQQAQIDALANLNSDDVLTPGKKPVWIFMHSFLTAEQAGLDTQATSYGITTEKTNYDNAITALTTHLATLTTAVAWNNLTGNTTIVGTTFRTKFNDVLTTKQALINAIAAAAKVLADAAQADADAAQTTANTGVTNAATAQTQANTATTNAATADAKAVAAAREAARLASYTSPTIVLTAADVGATATITIAAHTRVYPVQGTYDVPDVSISAGSITGRAFSTKYWVYYDDTTLAATGPTFLSTTTQLTAQVGSAAGRHLVGVVTTPADGAASTSGSGGLPPAGGGGDGTVLP